MPFSEGLGYKAAFYSLPDPVFVYDHTNRKIILSNLAAVALYGFSEEEFQSMGPWEIEAPYRKENILSRIDQLMQQSSVVYQTEHRNSKGETFPVEMHVTYRNFDGKDIFVGTCRELTERFETESRLEKAETHYRAIFENSISLISVADLKTGHYIDVNPAFESVLGYTKKELLAKPLLELVHPDDLDISKQVVEKLLSEGIPNDSFQNRCRHKDGHYIWLDWSSQPLTDKGLVYSVAHDISAQKGFEEKLRSQNQLMRLHVEQTPLGVIEWGLDYHVSEWNQSAEQIFGYTHAEAIGQPGSFILPDRNYGKLDDVWAELASNKGGKRSKNINVHKNGSLLVCEWHNTSLVDAKGDVVGVASLVLDVTDSERRKQELKRAKIAAETANQAKSEFLSMMSHELRTPLNSIVGPCELLKQQTNDESMTPLLDVMLASSSHLLELINSILDLSKIESGSVEPAFEEINIDEFFAKRVSPLASSAENKGLRYDLEIRTSPNSAIRTDGTLLLQVLFNVIGNAVKFTEKGTIKVTVDHDGKNICISVSDTGNGISTTQQTILFEPFQQGNETLSKTQSGAGLGLSISKRIVELLDGKIECESVVGKGSVFRITLPGLKTKAYTTSQATNLPAKTTTNPVQPKILLVEDEPNNQLVTGAILKYLNYEHDIAGSGEDAVELWKTHRYPIVLMDVKLPKMDGIEATKRIKKLAGTDPLFVIAQSAYAMTEQKEKFLAEGMDDYISKPISIELLKDLLDKAKRAQANAGN